LFFYYLGLVIAQHKDCQPQLPLSTLAEDFEILHGLEKIILTTNLGNIDEDIRYEVTGGHCPYHQVFWIEENGEKYFLVVM
jgi:hypothetical protein